MTPVDNLPLRLLSGGEQELPTDIRLHARPKPIGELRTQPLSPAKYRLRGANAVVTRFVTGARQCVRSPAQLRSRPSSSRPPAAASSPASTTQLPRPPPSSTHERHSSSYSDCCETNCWCVCRSVTRVAAIRGSSPAGSAVLATTSRFFLGARRARWARQCVESLTRASEVVHGLRAPTRDGVRRRWPVLRRQALRRAIESRDSGVHGDPARLSNRGARGGTGG